LKLLKNFVQINWNSGIIYKMPSIENLRKRALEILKGADWLVEIHEALPDGEVIGIGNRVEVYKSSQEAGKRASDINKSIQKGDLYPGRNVEARWRKDD
jgi:hypothetical protein